MFDYYQKSFEKFIRVNTRTLAVFFVMFGIIFAFPSCWLFFLNPLPFGQLDFGAADGSVILGVILLGVPFSILLAVLMGLALLDAEKKHQIPAGFTRIFWTTMLSVSFGTVLFLPISLFVFEFEKMKYFFFLWELSIVIPSGIIILLLARRREKKREI